VGLTLITFTNEGCNLSMHNTKVIAFRIQWIGEAYLEACTLSYPIFQGKKNEDKNKANLQEEGSKVMRLSPS
jgi:hypothetical protein